MNAATTSHEIEISTVDCPKSIVMFGYNGSGKGSQAKRLVKQGGYAHISTGDKLRAITEKPAEALEIQIAQEIAAGILVSNETIRRLLDEFFYLNAENEYIIIDGAVRTPEQKVMVQEMLAERGRAEPTVLHIQVPRSQAFSQIQCRAKIENRADDADPKTINKRLDTYESTSLPALQQMRSEGFEVIDIDGTSDLDPRNASPDDIQKSIQGVYQRIVTAFARRSSTAGLLRAS
jgi:adenylate kinase